VASIDKISLSRVFQGHHALRLGEIIPGHHDARGDSVREQSTPIAPQGIDFTAIEGMRPAKGVHPVPKQELCSVDISNSANDTLIHQDNANGPGCLAHTRGKDVGAFLSPVIHGVWAQARAHRVNLVGRKHLTHGGPSKIGKRIIGL